MSYSTDELMSEMSDRWDKRHDSNLYKVLDIFNTGVNQIESAAEEVATTREISKAGGAVLDLHGADRKVSRINDDDEFYRFLISLRAMLATATGSYASIKEIITKALQTNAEVRVWQTEPHHIKISLPLLNNATIQNQLILTQNLQEIVALGDWIDGIQWETSGDTTVYTACYGYCSEGCFDIAW